MKRIKQEAPIDFGKGIVVCTTVQQARQYSRTNGGLVFLRTAKDPDTIDVYQNGRLRQFNIVSGPMPDGRKWCIVNNSFGGVPTKGMYWTPRAAMTAAVNLEKKGW